MKSVSDYRLDIETAISYMKLPEGKYNSLYEPIKYAMSAGGKRLRPVLTLMGADAFGNCPEKAVDAALGIELFHNFTLLHDDVMDKSDVRRGRPTVHKKYNENSAILSGDTMLTLATKKVLESPENCRNKVVDVFNNVALQVYEGQQLDMDFENAKEISVEEYTEMIEGKTGSLLGGAVKIGALIGGASDKDADLMYDFGVMTGLAFQIQDDWLDTFGDPTTFGKPIGGDINNGKKTYLYVAAFAKYGAEAEALKSAYEIPAGEMRIKTVKRLFEKAGIDEICKKTVSHYSSKALKALNSTSLSEDKKEAFRKFAEKLIGRKK